MARPEQILTPHSPATKERIIPRISAPIKFHAIEKIDALAQQADATVMGSDLIKLFDRGETLIDLDKIIPMALKAFDDNTLLEDSLAKLHLGGEVQEIDVCNLQLGTFALHLLYRVKTGQGIKYFVSYVSRFATDINASYQKTIPLGSIAESDFQNLSYLSTQFSAQNKAVRQKYSVLKPLSYATTHQFGKEFGMYTTEFEEKGELHVSEYPLGEEIRNGQPFVTVTVPKYYYGIKLDPAMEQEDKLLEENIQTMKRKLGLKQEKSALQHMPEYQLLLQQQKDVVLANAVLYLVAGHHFPQRLMINAGDWMVTFKNKHIDKMTFVTTRGMLHQMNEKDWIDYMFYQREGDYLPELSTSLRPFAQLTRWDILQQLDKAKKITGIGEIFVM